MELTIEEEIINLLTYAAKRGLYIRGISIDHQDWYNLRLSLGELVRIKGKNIIEFAGPAGWVQIKDFDNNGRKTNEKASKRYK